MGELWRMRWRGKRREGGGGQREGVKGREVLVGRGTGEGGREEKGRDMEDQGREKEMEGGSEGGVMSVQ